MVRKGSRIQSLVLAVVLLIGALFLGAIIAYASPSDGLVGKTAASVTGPGMLSKVVQGFDEQIAGNITIAEETITTGSAESFNGGDLWLHIAPSATATARGVTFSGAPSATLTAGATGNRTIGAPTLVRGDLVRIPISETTPTTESPKRLMRIVVSNIRYNVTASSPEGTVTVHVIKSETTPTTITSDIMFGETNNARVVSGDQTLFPDVSRTMFAAPAISFLKARGVISGFPDGMFKPQMNVTRAEFAKMAVEARGLTLIDTETLPFNDVPRNHWAFRFIATAKAAGLVEGYPDGSFRPNNNITRAEIAAILVRAAGFATNTSGPRFPDVPRDYWAFNEIMTARNNNIVHGFADGTFRPNNLATRAEAAQFVFNWDD